MIIIAEKSFDANTSNFPGKRIFQERSLWVIPVKFSTNGISIIYNMLLDTGSQITTLDSDDAELITINDPERFTQASGAGGQTSLIPGEVDELCIGDITFGQSTIHIGELIPQFRQHNISGVLGANILNQMRITLDYPEQRLEMKKRFVPLQ